MIAKEPSTGPVPAEDKLPHCAATWQHFAKDSEVFDAVL